MAKNVTMKDIALELGISTVSVSKALTDKEGVSEELREKIKEKALEMGYRYNSAARAVKEGTNGNVGILVADRFFEDCSFYNNMYRHVTLNLSENGYFGLLEIISPAQEKECIIPNIIKNNKIDGLIVMGQMDKAYIEALVKVEIPFVFLDFYNEIEGVECITSDSIFGMYQLTNYLIKLGHKEIGFIGTLNATSSIMDRYLGYIKSLIQHGLESKSKWVIPDRDEMGKFIDLELPEKLPTAFVCNCDEIGYLLIQKLKAMRIRVPEDISVVGFDDFMFATISDPQLTTFKVDLPLMAQSAVNSIIKTLEHRKMITTRKVIGGRVIIRESTASVIRNNC